LAMSVAINPVAEEKSRCVRTLWFCQVSRRLALCGGYEDVALGLYSTKET
jgi:hypothetical protein